MTTMQDVLRSIADGNANRLSKILGRKAPSLHPEDLTRPLVEAVKLGQEKCVKDLLAAGADPNCCLEDGKTPLYLLVEVGGAKPVILRHLLDAGANPNRATGSLQWTPLHMAAKRGYQVCVKALLAAGGRVDKRDSSGNTPLMLAASHGHVSVIKTLLLDGADRHVTNLANETPLHLAARAGHVDCVRDLLEYGAYPNARDNRGQTPLLLACKYQRNDVTDILFYHKCDVNAQDTVSGRTALHWAVERGDYHLVTELLAADAQPDIRDAEWQTPFMVALARGSKDIMEILLHVGCQVDVTDSHLNTALHLACRDGRSDLIPMLVDAGINVDIKGESGLTPLMLASFGAHEVVVSQLLNYGAQSDLRDRYRASALVYALLSPGEEISRHDVIKQLIRMSCDVNKSCNLASMVRSLAIQLDKDIDVEERQYCPLEIAFLRGHTTDFMMLLKAGADCNAFQCDRTNNAVLELRNISSELRTRWYLLRCLNKQRTQVKTLKELCRPPVLHNLSLGSTGSALQRKIRGLSIAEELKQFLSFSDLDEIESQFTVTLRENKRRSGPARLENILEEPNKVQLRVKRRTFSAYSSTQPGNPSRLSLNGSNSNLFQPNLSTQEPNYSTFPRRHERPKSSHEMTRSVEVRGSTDSLHRGRPSGFRSSMESLTRSKTSTVRSSNESLSKAPLTRSRSMRISSSSSSSSRSEITSPTGSLRRTGSLRLANVQAKTDSGLRSSEANSTGSANKSLLSPTKISSPVASPGAKSPGVSNPVGLRRTTSMKLSSPTSRPAPLKRSSSFRHKLDINGNSHNGSVSPTERVHNGVTSPRSTSPVNGKLCNEDAPDRCLSPASTLHIKPPPKCVSPANSNLKSPERKYLNGDSVSNGETPLRSILRRSTSNGSTGSYSLQMADSSCTSGTSSPVHDDDVFPDSPNNNSKQMFNNNYLKNNGETGCVSPRPHGETGCVSPRPHSPGRQSPSRIPIPSPKKEVQFVFDDKNVAKKKKPSFTDKFKNWKI